MDDEDASTWGCPFCLLFCSLPAPLEFFNFSKELAGTENCNYQHSYEQNISTTEGEYREEKSVPVWRWFVADDQWAPFFVVNIILTLHEIF